MNHLASMDGWSSTYRFSHSEVTYLMKLNLNPSKTKYSVATEFVLLDP